jgi:hypothetical protein
MIPSSALAVEGGRRLDRFEKPLLICGLWGWWGLGGSLLRRGEVGVGVGSKVSERGDVVGSSNSKANLLGERRSSSVEGAGVVIVGGRALRVVSEIGEPELADEFELTGEPICGEFASLVIGAAAWSFGGAGIFGVSRKAGEEVDEGPMKGEAWSEGEACNEGEGDAWRESEGEGEGEGEGEASGLGLRFFCFPPPSFFFHQLPFPALLSSISPRGAVSIPKPRPRSRSALLAEPTCGCGLSETIVIVDRLRVRLPLKDPSTGVSGGFASTSSSSISFREAGRGSSSSCRCLIRSRRA